MCGIDRGVPEEKISAFSEKYDENFGASAEFYDYDDKYNSDKSVCVVPASIRRSTLLNLKTLACEIYKNAKA